MDEVELAEAELRQDSILLAWIQTAVGKDHDTKTMTIGEHSIESSTSAKNLGVTFDSELGMNLHVNSITRSCLSVDS